MSLLTNRLQIDENLNGLLALREANAAVWQTANYSAWIETILKDTSAFSKTGKHLRGYDVLQASTFVAAILFPYQTKAVDTVSAENFQVYCNLAFEAEKLNYPQSALRFVVPKIDYRPIDVADEPKTKSADEAELEMIFNGLANIWREATGGYSLTMRRYAHASYQSILALEPKRDVISLILRELQQRPDRWFEALKALTKTNPAQDAKTFDETVRRWIEWGQREKYIS